MIEDENTYASAIESSDFIKSMIEMYVTLHRIEDEGGVDDLEHVGLSLMDARRAFMQAGVEIDEYID